MNHSTAGGYHLRVYEIGVVNLFTQYGDLSDIVKCPESSTLTRFADLCFFNYFTANFGNDSLFRTIEVLRSPSHDVGSAVSCRQLILKLAELRNKLLPEGATGIQGETVGCQLLVRVRIATESLNIFRLNAQSQRNIPCDIYDQAFSLRSRSGPRLQILFPDCGDLFGLKFTRFWETRLTSRESDVRGIV